jgi:hypothetical protein
MKVGFLKVAAVGAALLIPATGLTVVATGTAGAATYTLTFKTTASHTLSIAVSNTGHGSAATIKVNLAAGWSGTTNVTATATKWCTVAAATTATVGKVPINTVTGLSTKPYHVKVTFAGTKACIWIPIGNIKIAAGAKTGKKTVTIIGTAGVTASYITLFTASGTTHKKPCWLYTGTNVVLHNAVGLSTVTNRPFAVTPTPTTLAGHHANVGSTATTCTTAVTPTITAASSGTFKVSGSQELI